MGGKGGKNWQARRELKAVTALENLVRETREVRKETKRIADALDSIEHYIALRIYEERFA